LNPRLISIIRKEFIQLFRDKRMLALILLVPLVQMVLLSYVFSNDVKDLPMAVFDQSHSAESTDLLDAYQATDYFKVSYAVNTNAEMTELIEKGKVGVGLVIPPDYAARLYQGNAQVSFVIDGSDPSIASTALSVAQLIAQSHSTKLLLERLARSGLPIKVQPPLEVRTTVWYNPDMVSAFFMIPGVIAMILYAITALLTSSAMVREVERGTIEQLIVTPIRQIELVVGKILPYVILGLFDAAEVIAFGHFAFGVPVRGSLLLITCSCVLFLFSGLGIGLLASSVAKTQQEAMLTVFMTLLPGIFLSGFLFPVNNFPWILQALSYLIPMRFFLTIIRVLMIKGVGFSSIQHELLALAIFGTVIMGGAAMRIRKRLD
jgi:ABC-2 type transport system permease protein